MLIFCWLHVCISADTGVSFLQNVCWRCFISNPGTYDDTASFCIELCLTWPIIVKNYAEYSTTFVHRRLFRLLIFCAYPCWLSNMFNSPSQICHFYYFIFCRKINNILLILCNMNRTTDRSFLCFFFCKSQCFCISV